MSKATNDPNPTTLSLLEQLQSSEKTELDQGLRRLFSNYQNLFRHWVHRFLGADSDYEDVVQDVSIVVLKKIGNWTRKEHFGRGSFRYWLKEITRMKCLAHFRTQSLGTIDAQDIPIDDENIADPFSILSYEGDTFDDDPTELIDDLHKRATETGLSAFNEKHQLIFLRVLRDGQSYSEVAVEFGITELNCRKIVSRIRARINSELGDLEKTESSSEVEAV